MNMCYSYVTVFSKQSDSIYKVPRKEYFKLVREGVIIEGGPKPYYAKATVPVIVNSEDGNHIKAMHWDLIPHWYKSKEGLSIPEVIKAKNSKAEGFTSFNARAEDIRTKPSFRTSWKNGNRCIFPGVVKFRERPNRKDMPKDFEKKEYEIELSEESCFAGIYDTWKTQASEELISATLITIDGMNHPVMASIWHGRQPAILTIDAALKYLEKDTSSESAYKMLTQFPSDKMSVLNNR